MRIAIRLLAGFLAAAALAAAGLVGPYALRVERLRADPALGCHADGYYYVSPKARRLAREGRAVTVLVQPNNSGTSSDDPEVHRKDAWWTGLERRRVADELGVVLLVPAFVRPGEDWIIYTHALDRDALTTRRPDLQRIDLQLIAMIDRTRELLGHDGIATDTRVLIQGFSASGMFANRFTALHPDRVKAATIGSPGGFPILPVASHAGETLAYPAGVADLTALTGTPFASEAFNAVPQLIYMGSLDDNDSLDFGDGWDREHAAVVDRLFGPDPLARWDRVRDVYREAGSSAEFLLVEGVAHDRRKLQRHATAFFRRVLGQEDLQR
jgi:dienelactone hydrolase